MSTFFLLVCTALSLFVTLTGLTTINNLSSLIFQMLFLPVTLLLVQTSLTRIFLKTPIAVPLSGKKNTLLFIALLIGLVVTYKLYLLL